MPLQAIICHSSMKATKSTQLVKINIEPWILSWVDQIWHMAQPNEEVTIGYYRCIPFNPMDLHLTMPLPEYLYNEARYIIVTWYILK